MAVRGSGFAGRGQNQGMMFVKLRDWDLRDGPGLRAKDVAGKAMRRCPGAPRGSRLRLPAAGRHRARLGDRLRPDAAGPG